MGTKLGNMMLDACDALIEDAAALVMPHEEENLLHFAARLSGLGGCTDEQVREATTGVEISGDFRHLTCFAASTSGMGSSMLAIACARMEATSPAAAARWTVMGGRG